MKLSIVMLAYNHERFIAKALDSILMQDTFFDYEVIVGEDCSSDSTMGIIKTYEQKFRGRLKPIYRNKNIGALRNMLDCLGHCTGEYLAFLEGDDCWESTNKISLQLNYLEKHPDCVMCASNWNVVDIDGHIISQGLDIQNTLYFDEKNLSLFEIPAQTSTLMVRNVYFSLRDKYMKYLRWYAWIPLDRLIVPILLKSGTIAILPQVTSNYRWYIEENGSNWSSKHEVVAKSNRLYFYIMIMGIESFSKKIGISIDFMNKKVELFYENFQSRRYVKNKRVYVFVYVQAFLMVLLEPHKIRLVRSIVNKRRLLRSKVK